MKHPVPPKETPPVWPVREAKGKLSEILRRARTSGPQIIGTRNPCIVVPKEVWEDLTEPRIPLTSWLIENSPGVDFELPPRGQSDDRVSPYG
ncbi:MAG: hypothetical protein DRP71_16595 [Verrucomicrobia bacterium]|nr:MAG: hypothetical protein DRP71_16595 [Verrucomicrobiota bacterium]